MKSWFWNPYGRTRFRGVPFTHTRRWRWYQEWLRFRRRLWWNRIDSLSRDLGMYRSALTSANLRARHQADKLKDLAFWQDAAGNAMQVIADLERAFPQTMATAARRLYPNQVTMVETFAEAWSRIQTEDWQAMLDSEEEE